MTPAARRILVPLFVSVIACAIVVTMMLSKKAPAPEDSAAATPTETPAEVAPADADATTEPGADAGADTGEAPNPSDPTATGDLDLAGLHAAAPATGVSGHDTPAESLGSLDPNVDQTLIEFSRAGAGISRLVLSEIWETARSGRQASEHYDRNRASPPELPDESLRYVLQETHVLLSRYHNGWDVPALAAYQVKINGQEVNLFDYTTRDGARQYVWAETDPGQFETTIVNGEGTPIAHVVRRFSVNGDYSLALEQRVENLTSTPLRVQWVQFGPNTLRVDRSRYMDRRRARFGYLTDPNSAIILAEDNDLLLERRDLLKSWKKAIEADAEDDQAARREHVTLWPNDTSREKSYDLGWFGLTNRYFALTVYPPAAAPGVRRTMSPNVERILLEVSGDPAGPDDDKIVFTYLVSPERTVAGRETLVFDLGVYAGPLDRWILNDEEQPFAGLSLRSLILYQMSSLCAICTFQWLAHFLLGFLSLLNNYVLFDWGFAIVGLVLVVRTILHPITKRSQISMQRFGKQMSEMKPELDRLQKKFPGEPKKLQQEQIRMMRERGINPLQMLGCLPMFLQTPIWIALYAMLYFAFDIRQEPAFFGVFQWISAGAWPFLADLSASDHFFGELNEPRRFMLWNITGFNILPILMGGIFYVQQKYMSPPPSPTMTADQLKQQKIMKIMMIVMFPVMLYSAPSGLTLYILTSSTIGVLESRYIRNHIKEMDLNPPKREARAKAKSRDAQGRAYASAMDRMKQKRMDRKKGPPKRYKKRDK
ncbi:MAG: membrane protein insertase YidC [Planctomycetes bacterium]|nr:membrane protein insertase YidC [Planctomycetota bacterium]